MDWDTTWSTGLLFVAVLNILFGIYYDIKDVHEKATRHLLWAIALLMLRAVWLEEILVAP